MKNNDITKELQSVLDSFKIENEMTGIKELKSGHINTTYLVYTRTPENTTKAYVVQKINTYVFKNPYAVMNNIDLVTTHIREINPDGALHFHHTHEGKNYIAVENGFWRLYTYKDGNAFDECSVDVLESCGRAFGEFQQLLEGFDASSLEETIPDFHNTEKRYQHLLETIKKDPLNRVKKVKHELDIVESIKEICLKVCRMNAEGKFPTRTTHNDTKSNNVLLKDNLDPLVVIDLDTVMPGLIMHDFGDAIRYGANNAKEDESDLSKVKLSLPKFYAFARGFIPPIKHMLTKDELDCMALGAIAMTFECGIRFLDDYIDGDNYFKIDYTIHNLDRARCQLKLACDMIDHLDEMNKIISIL